MTTMGPRGRTDNQIQLQSACGKYLTADDFAAALLGTGVKTVLIAGCTSSPFAADLSTRREFKGIRFGGLQGYRYDEVSGDEKAISHFSIVPQPVKWWTGH
jgi:hypothetical protein